MQAALERDKLGAFGINRREQQRAFVRLCARRAEKSFLQIARRNFRKTFGKVDKIFREVNVANMLKRFNLLNHAFGDERVAVPAVDDRNARIAIEIFFARRVDVRDTA